MSAYAAFTTAALVVLASGGFAETAGGIAAGIALYALLLELTYRARRDGDPPPMHRRRLDRLVRLQWAGCVIVVALVAMAGWTLDLSPDARTRLQFVDGGVIVALLALWLSALIDWYWILPRLAGIGGPPPCRSSGDDMWNNLTKVWLYHRALATLLFIGGVAAIPGYFAVATNNQAFAVVLGVITFGIPAVMSKQAAAAVDALLHGLNPPVPVGSIASVLLLRGVLLVYIVDASLQGSKFKEVRRRAKWGRKSDGPPIGNEVLASNNWTKLEDEKPSPCGEGDCTRVNWYCRHNRLAYTRRG